jgi:hypothetical protein
MSIPLTKNIKTAGCILGVAAALTLSTAIAPHASPHASVNTVSDSLPVGALGLNKTTKIASASSDGIRTDTGIASTQHTGTNRQWVIPVSNGGSAQVVFDSAATYEDQLLDVKVSFSGIKTESRYAWPNPKQKETHGTTPTAIGIYENMQNGFYLFGVQEATVSYTYYRHNTSEVVHLNDANHPAYMTVRSLNPYALGGGTENQQMSWWVGKGTVQKTKTITVPYTKQESTWHPGYTDSHGNHISGHYSYHTVHYTKNVNVKYTVTYHGAMGSGLDDGKSHKNTTQKLTATYGNGSASAVVDKDIYRKTHVADSGIVDNPGNNLADYLAGDLDTVSGEWAKYARNQDGYVTPDSSIKQYTPVFNSGNKNAKTRASSSGKFTSVTNDDGYSPNPMEFANANGIFGAQGANGSDTVDSDAAMSVGFKMSPTADLQSFTVGNPWGFMWAHFSGGVYRNKDKTPPPHEDTPKKEVSKATLHKQGETFDYIISDQVPKDLSITGVDVEGIYQWSGPDNGNEMLNKNYTQVKATVANNKVTVSTKDWRGFAHSSENNYKITIHVKADKLPQAKNNEDANQNSSDVGFSNDPTKSGYYYIDNKAESDQIIYGQTFTPPSNKARTKILRFEGTVYHYDYDSKENGDFSFNSRRPQATNDASFQESSPVNIATTSKEPPHIRLRQKGFVTRFDH